MRIVSSSLRNAELPDTNRRRSPASRTPARTARAEQAAGRALALCHALLSEQGEVSGRRLAAYALSAYQSLGPDARELFFDRLATDFGPDPKEVDGAAARYRLDASSANLIRLQAAVEPPRQELFRRANMAPGGTAVLLDMRRELLKTLRQHPERAGIDADLIHLFRSWFNRGFLVLQRIDWHTPAVILERLIQYEAVHEIQGWRDLRRRLEGDRRCYAFFHPVLPDEPLVFIEVALTRGMSAAVQPLLDPDSPIGDATKANCAIFYSITNCQEGLEGRVVRQLPDQAGGGRPRARSAAAQDLRDALADSRILSVAAAEGACPDPLARARCAAGGGAEGQTVPTSAPRLAVRCATRSPGTASSTCCGPVARARPVDSVARFHLANGARLERLNWMGDPSKAGIRRSLGLMVNYVYRRADLERNHEAYVKRGKIVAAPRFGRLRGAH